MAESADSRLLPPGLYLVATPIGNLGDMTYRAVETLNTVDAILCEDTRISRRLLDHYSIETKLQLYNDFSDEADRVRITDQLLGGLSLALISDAGMPLISDPGFKLLAAVRDAGLPVTAIPGPTAFATALALSGLPPQPALFAGFLPTKSGQRKTALKALRDANATLIFHESPRRLKAGLTDMAAVLGNRQAALLRELTKRHEQIATGDLEYLIEGIGETIPARGEFVVVVGPPDVASEAPDDSILDALLQDYIAESGLKEAVKRMVRESGRSRNAVYQRALELKSLDESRDNSRDSNSDPDPA